MHHTLSGVGERTDEAEDIQNNIVFTISKHITAKVKAGLNQINSHYCC